MAKGQIALRRRTEKFVTGISIGTSVISLVMLLAGVFRIGISVDEPLHFDMLVRFGARFELSQDYTFGPIPWVAGHLVNVAFGFEAFGHPNESAEAYYGRHLSVAIFGVIGALGVSAIVWLKTRGILWPSIGFALMLSFPLWLGHSMFNPKDIPNAAGFVVFVLGILLLGERQGSRGRYLVGLALVWAGFFLSFGTRLSMAAPLALVWAVAIFVTISKTEGREDAKEALRPHAWAALGLAGLVVASFILLATLNPAFYLRGLEILIGSLQTAAEFPWEGSVLVAGAEIEVPPPWWFVPAFLLAQTPLAVMLPFVLSVIGAAKGVLTGSNSFRTLGLLASAKRVFSQMDVSLAVLLTQLLATPIFIAISGANIYDGVRHVLFILPALVVLAVFVARRVYGLLSLMTSAAFMGLMSFFLVSLTIQNVSLFPYNYSYYNELSALGGQIDENWETDYWHLSYRELEQEVPDNGGVICGFWPESPIDADVLPFPCRELKPFVTIPADADTLPGVHWLIMSQRYTVSDRSRVPDHCEEAGVLTRRLHFQDVMMSTLFKCELA